MFIFKVTTWRNRCIAIRLTNKGDSYIYLDLTTPTAKADGVLSHKHPTYHLPSEEAEVELLVSNS